MAYSKLGRGTTDPADARTAHLWLYVAGGLLLGVTYAAANTLFDVLDRKTPLVATLALVHSFVDRGVPLLAGAVHYWRLRSEVARRERIRADDLGRRLEHVERDQAVWLVATATLHEVRVLDNGPGIRLESRATLFEPLSTSKARGMGLGLSVSRALARAMNGDVVVTDVPGWSTCLEPRLPT